MTDNRKVKEGLMKDFEEGSERPCETGRCYNLATPGSDFCEQCSKRNAKIEFTDRAESEIDTICFDLNLRSKLHTAETGSMYFILIERLSDDDENDPREMVVRVSDHMECYPPEDGTYQISVAPGEFKIEDIRGLVSEFFKKI